MSKNWFGRNQGQSVVLIALVLAALILIVGLAVDAGNAYAAQRKAQSTSNAAAIAGTKRLAMARDNPGSYTDVDIRAEINNVVLENGFQTPDIIAEYLDAEGDSLGYVGSLGGPDTPPPTNAVYIRVRISTSVDTYFVRIAGFPQVGVNAATQAQNISTGDCGCTDGIYPLGVYDQGYARGDVYWIWDGADIQYPGTFYWLRWRQPAEFGDMDHLVASLYPGGNIADPQVGYWDGETHLLRLTRPMFGNTDIVGDPTPVSQALEYFARTGEPMLLPMWVGTPQGGGDVIYPNSGYGAWRLEEVCLDSGACPDTPEWMPIGVKALKLTFLGYSNSGCSVSVPMPPGEGGGGQDHATAEGLVYLCTPQVTMLPPDEGAHLPVDIIHTVDGSLSMSYPLVGGGGKSKLQIEKEALVYFNGLMRPDLGDRLGAVKLQGDNPDVTVLSDLTSDIGYLNGRIQALTAAGYTPWAKAVLVSTATLYSSHHNLDNKPVLIIASDGAPTVDLDNERDTNWQNLIWDNMSPESLRYCFEKDTCTNCCPWCTPAICPGPRRQDPGVEVLIDALDAADVVKGQRTVQQTWWVQRHGGVCNSSCPYYNVVAHPDMEIFVIAIKGQDQFSSSVLKYVATAPISEHYFEVYQEQDVQDIYTYIANAISGQLPYCYIHNEQTLFTAQPVQFQVIAGGAVIGEGGSLPDGSYAIPDIPVDPYEVYGITGTTSYGGMDYGAAASCPNPGQIGVAMPLPQTYQVPVYLVPDTSPTCPEGSIPIPDPNP
jgi:hypothetical protein